jgi:uncharacterized protein
MATDGDAAWLSQLGLLVKPAGPDCNLACTYCFYSGKSALYPEARQHSMGPEVARRLVRDYMDLAGPAPSFGWQGGEPTLLGVDFFRRVVALQAQTARPGTAIANGLQTNGTLINDEWARFLLRYRFLVGLSLDGPAEIHDHYRRDHAGAPTHERVLRAARTLRDGQVEFNVLCMVTDYSAGRAAEIMDYMLGQGLTFLQFIPCLERDPDSGDLLPFTCSPEGYGQFLCDAFDVWASEWPPRAYVRTFNDLLAAAAGSPAPTCVFRPNCADYILVEHNGDVYPCDFFVEPEYLLGNIMHTPLREIALSDAFRAFRNQKQPHDPTCLACEWLPFCHGACPRHRPGASDAAPGNFFCESYRMLFAHAMGRLREMAERLAAEGCSPTP